VRTLLSILIKRCLTIAVTSRPVSAYFSLLRRKTVRGRDSRSLWGPGEGRGACQIVLIIQQSFRVNVVFCARMFHSVYPTSMTRARRDASSAFWGPEPVRVVKVSFSYGFMGGLEEVLQAHPVIHRSIQLPQPKFSKDKHCNNLFWCIQMDCTDHIVL